VSVAAAAGVSVCEPLVASGPLQLSEPAQLVAPAEDQVIVVEPPTVTEFAAKVRVGAVGGGGTMTVRLTLLAADEPITLAQLSE
jgi:hypothetical protein